MVQILFIVKSRIIDVLCRKKIHRVKNKMHTYSCLLYFMIIEFLLELIYSADEISIVGLTTNVSAIDNSN